MITRSSIGFSGAGVGVGVGGGTQLISVLNEKQITQNMQYNLNVMASFSLFNGLRIALILADSLVRSRGGVFYGNDDTEFNPIRSILL
jgi:hypothetical protein